MIKRRLAAGLIVLSLSVMNVCTVFANNHTDRKIPKQYVSSSHWATTDYADKQDATSHYIYNACGLRVRVVSYAQNGANCTNNSYAVISANSKRFIFNSVWEDGYRNCRLSIRADVSGSSGNVTGWWSPDSIGSYPVANR